MKTLVQGVMEEIRLHVGDAVFVVVQMESSFVLIFPDHPALGVDVRMVVPAHVMSKAEIGEAVGEFLEAAKYQPLFVPHYYGVGRA